MRLSLPAFFSAFLGCASACATDALGPWPAADSFTLHAPARGLLASAGLEGEPIKGVYFFPGDVGDYNRDLYTAHPTHPDDYHWNSDASARDSVIDRVANAGANTLVMSFWGDDMTMWSPMELDANSVRYTIEAVAGRPLAIMPALESGFDRNRPDTPQWRFAQDFPYENAMFTPSALAPSLLARIRRVVQLFAGRMDSWTQMYDRTGRPRYAIHILHARALQVPTVSGSTADQVFAEAFDAIAREIAESDGIEIGFTLDVVSGQAGTFELTAERSGSALAASDAVLAIQGFISEIYTGEITYGPMDGAPFDNNVDSLPRLVAAKRAALQRWVSSGVPVILDVSSGFDGRYVWRHLGSAFWGDNLDYTNDDWRNGLSALKGEGYVGVTFNTWNGYTEGYAATSTEEHGDVIYRWLTDLYAADPMLCHHVDYQGGAPAHIVEGDICMKWQSLGAGLGILGAPNAGVSGPNGAVRQHFAHGSIFVTPKGVYEVHGAIAERYAQLGYDASCLGLPVADEEPFEGGRRSRFEHGDIRFLNGQSQWVCP